MRLAVMLTLAAGLLGLGCEGSGSRPPAAAPLPTAGTAAPLDTAVAPSPVDTTPPASADTSAPAGMATAAASAPGPSDACEQVCGYIEKCAPNAKNDACRPDCSKHLTQIHEPRDGPAQAYARCAAALSCRDIRRSLAMDMGPLGKCYSDAIHRRSQQ